LRLDRGPILLRRRNPSWYYSGGANDRYYLFARESGQNFQRAAWPRCRGEGGSRASSRNQGSR